MFPPVSFVLEIVDECTSSQEILLARRGTPGFHGSAVLALSQTAGYGRRGRDWASIRGNLALSIGLELPENPEALALLPFAAGLAAFATARKALPPSADLRLKWPNDIYLNGKKLSGLLAQARQTPDRRSEVVLGIGLNIAGVPPGLDQEAIALASAGKAPEPEIFARALLARLEEIFSEGADVRRLQKSWEAAARFGDGPLYVVGEAAAVYPLELLPTGELLVRGEHGLLRKLCSEEVSIRFVPLTAPDL